MSGVVYLNGEWVPKGEARVSVDDRGFMFGDGVYEVIRATHGQWFQGAAHLDRLADGMQGLRIAAPMDRAAMVAVFDRLLEENDLREGHATVYVQVTRGSAPRSHAFPAESTPPTVYAAAAPFRPDPDRLDRGIAAITVPDQRWSPCDLKTVNLLPNVLAKQAAADAGVAEAIMVRDGVVTEGSHTNVMAMVGGELRTHPLSAQVLPGITRAVVLDTARALGIPVRENALSAAELERADELLVCGTTTDVAPVVRLDGRLVGRGRPGPISQMLGERLLERMGIASGVPLAARAGVAA